MSHQRPALSFPSAEDQPSFAPPGDFESYLVAHPQKLSEQQIHRLGQYVSLLTRTNRLMNLTAIREPDEIWMRVIADSLTFQPALSQIPDGSTVLDLGCGAGVPGLVLAVACPGLQFTLLDATAKKIAFVTHVACELSLGNVRARSGRAETLAGTPTSSRDPGQGELRERFDWVVARAVAPLRVLLELTSPFAKPPRGKAAGGRLLLVKGQGADEELAQAQRALNELRVQHVETQDTPTGKLVQFQKLAPTPARYPRSNGVPKRQPL